MQLFLELTIPLLPWGKMDFSKRKRLQLSRVLFLLSGVFLCTLYPLTLSARLYEPLPMPQIAEDSGEGSKERVEEATVDTPTPAPAPPVTTITPTSPGEAPHMKGEYPVDLFSFEDRRQGWVILHIFGMMYMFISIAIVCDEFFIPALGVITDKLGITDDVAGATFMAAGGSAPRLLAFLIGVFIGHSNVGIGTIVGSAVFNIVFVIGICALFSREVLHLTWWPLFRDVSFYIVGLILLIIFFLDNVIMWWESMMLVVCYTLYMIFMKFNVKIEQTFKTLLLKNKNIAVAVEEPEKDDMPAGEDWSGGSEDAGSDVDDSDKDRDESSKNEKYDETEEKEKEEEKKDEPLSLEWPDTPRKQATYLLLLPIIVPLWLTVPDVRNQKSRKLFLITFLASILWIAVFSYFIVWWGHQVGETIGISDHIMATLAAESSFLGLITSVIVARKGLGDMAVSSSVGSNTFDITVGLPVPWLLYSSFHSFAPVAVSSNGLICAIVLLVIMLLFVIISIASCKWKMNKLLGVTLCLLYFIFLVLAMLLKYSILVCPVSVGTRA